MPYVLRTLLWHEGRRVHLWGHVRIVLWIPCRCRTILRLALTWWWQWWLRCRSRWPGWRISKVVAMVFRWSVFASRFRSRTVTVAFQRFSTTSWWRWMWLSMVTLFSTGLSGRPYNKNIHFLIFGIVFWEHGVMQLWSARVKKGTEIIRRQCSFCTFILLIMCISVHVDICFCTQNVSYWLMFSEPFGMLLLQQTIIKWKLSCS